MHQKRKNHGNLLMKVLILYTTNHQDEITMHVCRMKRDKPHSHQLLILHRHSTTSHLHSFLKKLIVYSFLHQHHFLNVYSFLECLLTSSNHSNSISASYDPRVRNASNVEGELFYQCALSLFSTLLQSKYQLLS